MLNRSQIDLEKLADLLDRVDDHLDWMVSHHLQTHVAKIETIALRGEILKMLFDMRDCPRPKTNPYCGNPDANDKTPMIVSNLKDDVLEMMEKIKKKHGSLSVERSVVSNMSTIPTPKEFPAINRYVTRAVHEAAKRIVEDAANPIGPIDDGSIVGNIQTAAEYEFSWPTPPPPPCPVDHDKLDGPCRYDYCRCDCASCKKQCEEGGR